MKSKNAGLPRGFKPVDRTVLKGRLENLGTIEQSLQAIMVRDERHRSESQIEENSKPQFRKVKKLSDIIAKSIQAANDLRSVTHFIKRAQHIWLTMLLKPNGEQKQLLRYDTESSDIKNQKLHETLLQIVENYGTTKYPIEDLPAQIIKDTLFVTGSYVLINLPHSALDHLINGMEVSGSESINSEQIFKRVLDEQFNDNDLGKAKNIGFIRKNPVQNKNEGFESLWKTNTDGGEEYSLVDPAFNWTFTDNPNVLKVGELQQKIRADKLMARSGFENIGTMMTNIFSKTEKGKGNPNSNHVAIPERSDLNEALSKLYKHRNYRHNESLSIRRSKFYKGTGKGIGITYHAPSESIIPVHANGEIGKPFGYIALVDPKTGEFLKSAGDVKFYQSNKQASGNLDTGAGYGSLNEMASHIKQIAQGGDCNFDMDWMIQLASSTLEKEFVESFFNGDMNKSVTVSLSEANKKIFLSRSFRQQGVRCVFIPAEYVTYIATDFNHLGIGRSLVEEAKLHITRLAVLDTADALAAVENSISKTELRVTLEKQNTDPRQLIAMIRDEYFASNPTMHDILGYANLSIDEVLDRFKEQQLIVKVDAGDNKHIIAPQIEATQAQHEPLKSVDRDVKEGLLNAIAGHFMLKRSWLEDTGEGVDFAIEALADQEILRNQASSYSREFGKFISDFLRKHIRCNEPLMVELVNVIRENKKLYEKPDRYKSLEEALDDGEKDGQLTEQEKVETVFLDFINNLYVELPQLSLNETLNKIENKIESIDKLVDRWMTMAGAELVKKYASEFNLEGEELMTQIKGVFMYDAFERFNLPVPFETILNDGDGGGILSIVNGINNLDGNVAKFFEALLGGQTKAIKIWDKLKEKFGTPEGEEPQNGQVEPSQPFMDDGFFEDQQLPPTTGDFEDDQQEPNEEVVESKEPDSSKEKKPTEDDSPFSDIELPPES